MLLLKIFFTTYQPSPDKGRLTCYELISYPFEIIIGLQKYGFSLNWQTISVFFGFIRLITSHKLSAVKAPNKTKTAGNKPHTINATIHNRQLATCSP